MPLWQYASQILIKLYPGMECMLTIMGLGESTSGQPSKNTSNNMGELDQQKLMLSMWHLFWFRIPFPANIPWLYRARSLPTWRRLYHFDKIMNISFSDATKLKDLVKVSIWLFFAWEKFKYCLDVDFCLSQCDWLQQTSWWLCATAVPACIPQPQYVYRF